MRILLLFLISVLLLCFGACKTESKPAQSKPPYTADWTSLEKYEVPEWYLDMKFGIYFHWGPYSVPAHETEWYSHWMYASDHPIRQHHEATYGPLQEFGYKDFIPQFTAEKFDAADWADLFVEAGAQFAGPVAEHADGFAMWDSKLTRWDAAEMGPKRDIVGEMEAAIKQRGLKFILTYHRHWLYAWYPTWDEHTDAGNPEFADLYGPRVPEGSFVMAEEPTSPLPDSAFNQEWLDRLNELMDNYEPDIMWFDNKMDIIDEAYRKRFLANFYNQAAQSGREVVCTYKFHDLPAGTAVLDLERSRMKDKKDFPWLTDDSIDWEAWCHISHPRYKSTNRLIDFLVDVVSKNGAVLLNITPTAEGVIPEAVRQRLQEVGAWLNINGEAIYGTRPWQIYGEGPAEVVEGHLSEKKNADHTEKDIRFTTKGEVLYAIVLDWPSEAIQIRSLSPENRTIKSLKLLGSDETIQWHQDQHGLRIEVPDQQIGEHAFCFRID